jgi:hypothetical protein
MDEDVNNNDLKSIVGKTLLVDCSSWDGNIAAELFGPNWERLKTPATVKKVTGTKLGRLKFELYFTEIEEIFTGFNWEYILKYIVDAFPSVFDSVAGILEEGKKARPAKKKKKERERSAKEQHSSVDVDAEIQTVK